MLYDVPHVPADGRAVGNRDAGSVALIAKVGEQLESLPDDVEVGTDTGWKRIGHGVARMRVVFA